jgi:hypothetical protein
VARILGLLSIPRSTGFGAVPCTRFAPPGLVVSGFVILAVVAQSGRIDMLVYLLIWWQDGVGADWRVLRENRRKDWTWLQYEAAPGIQAAGLDG